MNSRSHQPCLTCNVKNATENEGFRDSIIYYWISQGTEHRILHEEAEFPVIRTDTARFT